jgi:hypothetical protein
MSSFVPGDTESDDPPVIGTPEGDGDFESNMDVPDPEESLVQGRRRPAGNTIRDDGSKGDDAFGLEEAVDEVSRGKILP